MVSPAIGLGLSLAGDYMSGQDAADVERARNKSIADELARQMEYQGQAHRKLGDVLQGIRSPSAAYARTKAAPITPVAADIPMRPGAPAAVKTNLAKMMGRALEKGKDTARRQSRLGATSRGVREGVQKLSDVGIDLGLIRNFAQGSRNLLANELAMDSDQGNDELVDALKIAGNYYMGSN